MGKKTGGTTRRKPRSRRGGKQTYIEGTEPPRFDDIDALAEAYRDKRDERMELLEEEVKLKTELLEAMQEHKIDYYPIPDTEYEVVVTTGDPNVTVRKRKPKKADEEN